VRDCGARPLLSFKAFVPSRAGVLRWAPKVLEKVRNSARTSSNSIQTHIPQRPAERHHASVHWSRRLERAIK